MRRRGRSERSGGGSPGRLDDRVNLGEGLLLCSCAVSDEPGRIMVKAPLLLAEVGLGVIVYFAAARLLKISETQDIIDLIKRKLGRKS